MKVRGIPLLTLWNSQFFQALPALKVYWEDTHGIYLGTRDPIRSAQNVRQCSWATLCVLAVSLILYSLPQKGVSMMVLTVFLSIACATFTFCTLLDRYTSNAAKFVRSINRLDAILMEVGRTGIVLLPAHGTSLQMTFNEILTWEAQLKTEAERRNKFGEEVQKHERRFRALAAAITDMGFWVGAWETYYEKKGANSAASS